MSSTGGRLRSWPRIIVRNFSWMEVNSRRASAVVSATMTLTPAMTWGSLSVSEARNVER